MATLAQLQQWAGNRNVRALLDAIAYGEGANYNTYYGGGKFDPNGPHPCYKVTAGRWTSTAAGRYQFLCATWRGLASRYGFSTMAPANQDLAAIALISDNGGIAPILKGDYQIAVNAVKGIWPSLPGGSQQTRTWSQSIARYTSSGGAMGPTGNSTIVQGQQPASAPVLVAGAFEGSGYTGEKPLLATGGIIALALGGIGLYLLLTK
jgi:muramidase (phage lysozyme)